MKTHYPTPREDAPLVVFDFDHTLYDGDSGTHLFASLIKRNPLRMLAALLVTPIAGPMVALLPTRRAGISVYVWIGSFGLHRARDFNKVIDAYVLRNEAQMRAKLLPQALEVFAAHRAKGDRVVVATGAPPELARAILGLRGPSGCAGDRYRGRPTAGRRRSNPSLPQRRENAHAARARLRRYRYRLLRQHRRPAAAAGGQSTGGGEPEAGPGGVLPPRAARRHPHPQLGLR